MATEKQHIGQFYIQIDGRDLATEVMRQLDDAVVEDDLAQPAMFVLRFNDPELELTDGEGFRIGAEVKLGAASPNQKAGVILIGEITALEPSFEQHNLTLTVRGYDRSHRLHRGVRTRTFLNKTDDDIVREIAREARLTAKIAPVGVLHRYLIQHNQTDMEFLHSRAAALGYRVTVVGKELQFVPVEQEPPTAPELDYGVTLLSFRARLSAASQPSKVEVRGWDVAAKRAIVGSCERPSSAPQVNGKATAASVAKQGFGTPATIVVGDRPVASQDEAERMARAIYDEVSGDYLAAEGMCLGEPQLRAGVAVPIKNIGKRLSGRYYVTATRHEYTAAGGYTTRFFVTGRRPNGLLATIARSGDARQHQLSVAVGVVTNVDDPDRLGRVRMTFPWLDERHESDWARLALPGAGAKRGAFVAPAVGDEMLVAFEHGDINRPYVIGALWNGKDRPPDAAVKSGRDLTLLQTGGGHIVMLDDVDKKLTITSGEHTLTLDNQQQTLTLVAGDAQVTLNKRSRAISVKTGGEVLIEGQGGSLKIGASGVELTSNGSLKVDARAMLDVTSSAVVNVRGSMIKLNS